MFFSPSTQLPIKFSLLVPKQSKSKERGPFVLRVRGEKGVDQSQRYSSNGILDCLDFHKPNECGGVIGALPLALWVRKASLQRLIKMILKLKE